MGLINFFKCLLMENCKYSIKKFLTFFFIILAIYLGVFTDRIQFFDSTLLFVASLLSIRAFDRSRFGNRSYNNSYDYNDYNENTGYKPKNNSNESVG